MSQTKYREAIADLELVVRIEPDNTQALVLMGNSFAGLGDNKSAERNYSLVIQLIDNKPRAQRIQTDYEVRDLAEKGLASLGLKI